MARNELAGQRFGRLTVVEYADTTRNRKARWLCRCDCGNERVILGHCLTTGNTRSCGCLHTDVRRSVRIDLTGQRFSRLKVLDFVEKRDGLSYWRCACECGNEYFAYTKALRIGHVKSCGCLKPDTSRANGIRGTKHGQATTRTYKLWHDLIRMYRDGRMRVKIWENWFQFEAFFADMGECPKGHKLARHDRKSNYNKFNCYWKRKKEAVKC